MERTVDKTKKANIKCEYCGSWDREKGKCGITDQPKDYWCRAIRCDGFNWRTDKIYAGN